MMMRCPRRGNILLIFALLGIVIFSGVFSLGYMTHSDVSTTTRMLREIRASFLADSVFAQIEGQVNNTPWNQRFWLREAQRAGTYTPGSGLVPLYTFDKNCNYLNLSNDSLDESEYELNGQLKDLPANPLDASTNDLMSYRVYLEVTLKGEHYAFVADRHYSVGLLAGLNRDTALLGKGLDEGVAPAGAVDNMMNTIQNQVFQAPSTDGATPGQKAAIQQLRHDRKSFKAVALMQTPEAPPTMPR
jgi:hypothetical protein